MIAQDVDEVSAEVREDLATLMFGVQMMSEPSDSTSMELAYNILHKVSRTAIWYNNYTSSFPVMSGSVQHVHDTQR